MVTASSHKGTIFRLAVAHQNRMDAFDLPLRYHPNGAALVFRRPRALLMYRARTVVVQGIARLIIQLQRISLRVREATEPVIHSAEQPDGYVEAAVV